MARIILQNDNVNIDTGKKQTVTTGFISDSFEIALRNGKQNLYPLNKFVVLKGLPEDVRKTLKKDLEDFVAEIKKSLKDNVSKISSGREKMLILLNTFSLNEILE